MTAFTFSYCDSIGSELAQRGVISPGDPQQGTGPLTWRLDHRRFLDGVSGVASPSTLLLRSRYLLQSLATKLQLSGATTTVARNASVVCGMEACKQQQGQLLPKHGTTP
eukprot:3372429-Pleurochrysis_carterae.AAC.1